jgi:uncharacterized membrane protein
MKDVFISGKERLRTHYWLLLIFVVFTCAFASISFVNHANFRTYGWDLGINHNAIWDYAHFRWNDCMIMLPHKEFTNVLSDHFSLYPILVSPFYWIFGTWTMLIFQLGAILFGGLGVYKFIKHLGANKLIASLALIHFFSFYGIYSALGFDYHDNVVATMFVPWLLLAFRNKNMKQVLVYAILIMISKENMVLWLAFIGFALALRGVLTRDYVLVRWSVLLAFVSLIFFVLIIRVIIPGLAIPGGDYMHNSFTALGKNFGEVLVNLLKHPLDACNLLIDNHINQADYNGVKKETYIALVFAGGLTLLLTPEYLIMLLPIIGQKMFNDDPTRWGINYHYSIEFAPIIIFSFYTVVLKLNRLSNLLCFIKPQDIVIKPFQIVIAILGLILCMRSSYKFLDIRVSTWYQKELVNFMEPSHWKRDFNVNKAHSLLTSIPENARVSAQAPLAPHLAFRDYIYHFPYLGNANYIALLLKEPNPYPLTKDEYNNMIADFIQSGKWRVYKKSNSILILKKNQDH